MIELDELELIDILALSIIGIAFVIFLFRVAPRVL